MPSVTLIRHGQASFGKADYDQLSELGYDQSRHLGRVLREREERVDAVFIGAMKRHRQTAEACLAEAGLSALPLTVLPGFNEFNHEQVIERHEPRFRDHAWMASEMAKHANPGDFFGQMFRAAIARWVGGTHDADYDESWIAFQQRSRAALDKALGGLDSRAQVLVFTSGGCISVISQGLLGLADDATFRVNLTLANAGITRVIQGNRHRNLVTLNDHSHFSGRHRDLLSFR